MSGAAMTWAWAALFAIGAVVLIWRFARLPKGGVELVAAAALLGLAGYAWQATPAQPGTPVQSRAASVPPDPRAVAVRQMMTDTFGEAARVANFVDTLDRLGLTREAVAAARTGVRKEPRNPEAWVTLGNALVAHGGQTISPAAELAYRRAASLDPQHPAPPFFLGLAYAQSGRFDDADRVWRALLAAAPAEAPWRGEVQLRLAAVVMAKAQQGQ
jgi:cytochrome c-type biogenesis protein CcmH